MKIEVQCTECSKKFGVPKKYSGLRVLCPVCKVANQVPLASEADDRSTFLGSLDPPSKPGQSTVDPKPLGSLDPPRQGAVPPVVPGAHIQKNEPDGSNGGEEPKPKYAPYLSFDDITDPKLHQVPTLDSFLELLPGETLVSQYRIRVLRPKLPWQIFPFCILLWPLIPIIPLIVFYHYTRRRGHTFLYLTDQRLVILELHQGTFGHSQTVLNYEVDSISGFSLYAQRGVKKFINLFKLFEKRTFYISITTNTYDNFRLGSSNARKSNYDPGADAINLCSELDALLLGIKAGNAKKMSNN